jgi:hypothetical protein
MTDWKAAARAIGLSGTDEELSRALAPLETLEPAFDRLAASLTPDVEMAVVFDPETSEESGQ